MEDKFYVYRYLNVLYKNTYVLIKKPLYSKNYKSFHGREQIQGMCDLDAKVVSVDVETCLTNRITTYNVLFNVWSTPQPATTAVRSVGSLVSTSPSAECLNLTLDRHSQLWCQHKNFLFHFKQSHFQITVHQKIKCYKPLFIVLSIGKIKDCIQFC